ncbi:MAG: SIS domain-containing protein [Clostridiales bacterium]|nr:SIS domain-containing protein [Clostridiales bacterium]
MKNSTEQIIGNLKERYPKLEVLFIKKAIEEIIECYKQKNKLLICGNGGSASDSLHIVGELMKGFLLPRKLDRKKQESIKTLFPETAQYFIDNLQGTLPAISLVSETALSTAYANDQASDLSFAQQVLGHGNIGDILIAISTSGNSKNVIYAAQIAKVQGMKVISLTGSKGGKLKEISDILINVPSDETYIIQEYHLPVYHAICAAVENEIFSEEN